MWNCLGSESILQTKIYLLIIAVYIPTQLEEFKGNALLEKYISTENIIEDLKQMYPEDNLIIVGDLNLSKINWSNEDLLVFRGMGPVRKLNRSAASCVGMCLLPWILSSFIQCTLEKVTRLTYFSRIQLLQKLNRQIYLSYVMGIMKRLFSNSRSVWRNL